MKNGKLTRAECEHGIAVLRRVIADERESPLLHEAARDELLRLERILSERGVVVEPEKVMEDSVAVPR